MHQYREFESLEVDYQVYIQSCFWTTEWQMTQFFKNMLMHLICTEIIIHLYIKHNTSKQILVSRWKTLWKICCLIWPADGPPYHEMVHFTQAPLQKKATQFRQSKNCSLRGWSHSLVFFNNLWSLAKLLSFVLGKLIRVKICKLSQCYPASCALVLSFYSSKHFKNNFFSLQFKTTASIIVWEWELILIVIVLVAKVA